MRDFFSENNGRLSNVRLMSFICLLVALILAVYSIFRPVTFEIFLVLIVAAFAPKVIQKFAENSLEKHLPKQ